MSESNSKPLKPRQRKLQKDRAAGKAAKSAKSKKAVSKSSSTKTKNSKKRTINTKPKRFMTDEELATSTSRPKKSETKSRATAKSKGSKFDSRSAKSEPRADRTKTKFEDKPRSKRADFDGERKPRAKKSAAPRPRIEKLKSDRRVPNNTKQPTKLVAKRVLPTTQENETFESVGVHPALVKLLARDGITEPFAIQRATLPDAISGIDVLGRAQTGSGKTLAFGLAMLTKLAGRKGKPNQPLGLVLVPTRELAMQVTDALTPLAHTVDLDVRLIAGGMPYAKQIDALRRGVQILVSTPGRLSDLVDQGHADLSNIQIVVLDEADQMCDMGFMPQMVEILDLVPTKGQRLLFSATLDGDVDRLVSAYLKNPVLHETSAVGASVTTMEHHILVVDRSEKDEVLTRIAARNGKTILFVRTQAAADRVAGELANAGIPVGALHGGKSQNLRTRTINEFRDGVTDVLVATDVAARGIHVDGISLVVHVDPPGDPKDYLHRSGRTARAGDEGKVVTLIGPRQQRTVLGMMSRIGVTPEVQRVSANSRELVAITGAQAPSGKPWKLPKSAPSGGGRRQGGGQNRRKSSASGPSRRPRNG